MITTTKYLYDAAPNLVAGAANVKGSYGELLSAAKNTRSCNGIILNFRPTGGATALHLIDIAFGTTVILANMHCTPGVHQETNQSGIYIPLRIPEGTQVQARHQSNISARGMRVNCHFIHAVGMPSFSKATTYGADTGDSGGTQIDPGGTSGIYGSYVEMVASCDEVRWLVFCAGHRGNTAPASTPFLYHIGIGSAGSEVNILADPDGIIVGTATDGDSINPGLYSFPISIPEGTRIAIRAKTFTTDATDRLTDVVLVGFS